MSELLFGLIRDSFALVALCAAIPLGVAFVASLVVGFAQAATQIQDEASARVVRSVAVFGVLVLAAPLVASRFVALASRVFDTLGALQ